MSLAHQHCLSVTALLSPPSLSSLPTFPLVLGRRPALLTIPGANNSLEKENRPPENIAAGMTESLISKVSSQICNKSTFSGWFIIQNSKCVKCHVAKDNFYPSYSSAKCK